jgi:serine/threonine protein kinase
MQSPEAVLNGAHAHLQADSLDMPVCPEYPDGLLSDRVPGVARARTSQDLDFKDRYLPTASLGRGGMSMVWQARQTSLCRDVALKVAHDRLGAGLRCRFLAEATCAAFLEHPNIVPVYDAGADFIVMKRIEGDTLERLLIQDRLRLPEIIDILIKVCDAVCFAHSRGIIHRDIKPDNIMIGRFGEVMLMDWGLALQIDLPPDGIARAPAKGPPGTMCAGTPGYMAPEMARGDAERISYATDVFLLGCTLYRCLCGCIPFDAPDAIAALTRSADNDWFPVLQLNEHAPPRLMALQERCMADEPSERPAVREMQGVLRDWLMSANAETEAERCLARSAELLDIARNAGRRSDEAYSAYSEALHYLERAVTLCPDRIDNERIRADVVREFAWAAASAGEPALARLLRRNGRLPGQGVHVDASIGQRAENSRLAGSLADAGLHIEALGRRVAELEAHLSKMAGLMKRWRFAAYVGGFLVLSGALLWVL